ncbi:MAG: AMP-binding protein [Actinophytocola sp.]|nr:AMP-binding protein [Actinophytocola sp.]
MTTQQSWHTLYSADVDARPALPEATVLDLFRRHVTAEPEACALRYFGRDISRGELDSLSDHLAHALAAQGVTAGARVAIALQNTPVFVQCALAAWKLNAVVVPVNPMSRARELGHLLRDCTPKALVAHPDLAEVVRQTGCDADLDVRLVWSDPSELGGTLPAPWPPAPRAPEAGVTLTELLSTVPARGDIAWNDPEPHDTALLTYTSGTTGPSKGAMSTHANLTYQAVVSGRWFGLAEGESLLTTAPLFHITGLGLHLAAALGNGVPMVLTYRFQAEAVLRLLHTYSPTVTVGAITAFIALADHADAGDPGMAALRTSFSGGAPVPRKVVERYRSDFGVYVHNIYGLTETSSACIAVPRGRDAPVDQDSGALSIGVPLPLTDVRLVDDTGEPMPPGTTGEIVVRGPGVGPGYWNRPEETANAFRADGLHTGDVGIMDEHGWVFVVDRKKDLLVVSGYKVWPRDVEDVLYLHPAIREAAVVGRPDEYQGESVQAFVALRVGQTVTTEQLREHCRTHLAAYKVPRSVEFLAELPKTATGKIMRRQLRGSELTATTIEAPSRAE